MAFTGIGARHMMEDALDAIGRPGGPTPRGIEALRDLHGLASRMHRAFLRLDGPALVVAPGDACATRELGALVRLMPGGDLAGLGADLGVLGTVAGQIAAGGTPDPTLHGRASRLVSDIVRAMASRDLFRTQPSSA